MHFTVFIAMLTLIPFTAFAAPESSIKTNVQPPSATIPPSDDIEDNSFLIEEAFNQEPGVEQHINFFQIMKDGSFLYSFTEESPILGHDHQLSVTIPYMRTESGLEQTSGLGDIALNYRYQLIENEGFLVSPRFSILLPSASSSQTGSGVSGYQVNLPLSVKLQKSLITHWNLGATSTTDMAINYGMSLIWLTTNVFNLMLEISGTLEDTSNSIYLNPGMRYAFNFSSGLQIVPGISFPVGTAAASGKYGMLTYLSFEHPMF